MRIACVGDLALLCRRLEKTQINADFRGLFLLTIGLFRFTILP